MAGPAADQCRPAIMSMLNMETMTNRNAQNSGYIRGNSLRRIRINSWARKDSSPLCRYPTISSMLVMGSAIWQLMVSLSCGARLKFDRMYAIPLLFNALSVNG